jgi:hypothetical protein
VYFYGTFQVKARDGRAEYSLVLYDKLTLSLKTTEKEVAQLIFIKDEKCIRQLRNLKISCHFTKTVFHGAKNFGDCVNGTTVYNDLFRIAPLDAYMFN